MAGSRGSGPGREDLEAEAERQARDQDLLELGRLPEAAVLRLAEIGTRGLAFTSDLTPGEAGLLRRQGFAPIALVTGSAMYHVGYASASAWHDTEVAELSAAYNHATRLAASRMELEAGAARADGVVGVRYAITRHEWATGTVEVSLVGTAVRAAGEARAAGRAPWLCDLSGQEWYTLWRAGYQPVALAYGHCTWFVLTTLADEWNEASPVNNELEHFSEALGQCRTRAARHMTGLAREAGASGVVGVHIARRLDEVRLTGYQENPVYEREHHNLVLSMIGTAIQPRPGPGPKVAQSALVLSLRGGTLASTTAADEARFR